MIHLIHKTIYKDGREGRTNGQRTRSKIYNEVGWWDGRIRGTDKRTENKK